MKFVTPRDFTAAKAWGALPIAEIEGATIRLHWTDRPYIWHVNDGAEVFVVLEGAVTMITAATAASIARRCRPATSATPSTATSMSRIRSAPPACW
jgi:hypothetical protein